MKTWAECAYYLMRAFSPGFVGQGIPESDEYFEDALKHVQNGGLPSMQIEIDALVAAAKRRGRLAELDAAVGEQGEMEL